MSRIVIVGGAGFLGKALIGALDDREVICFDRLPLSRSAPLPPHVKEELGDAADPVKLRDCIAGADAVWIRAGVLGGTGSTQIGRAADYIAGNVELVRSVLDVCSELGCGTVLFDSTEQVWGTSGDLVRLVADGEPMAPNFYGASKLISEKLLRRWAMDDLDRSVQIFRYSRVHGAHSRDVIYYMVKSALAGDPIRIIGNPFHRVSFVHLEDVIAANLSALRLRPRFAIHQVSCDRPYSLFDVAQLVMEVAGRRVPIKFESAAATTLPFEPFVTGMEWEQSSQALGFWPKWSLTDMIREVRDTLAVAPTSA
jgi:nucleoside-diphosphate-sugar epimerase